MSPARNAESKEGVVSDVGGNQGLDMTNAMTLGALGVGAVGSLVYALYAERENRRRANRRIGFRRRNGKRSAEQPETAERREKDDRILRGM